MVRNIDLSLCGRASRATLPSLPTHSALLQVLNGKHYQATLHAVS